VSNDRSPSPSRLQSTQAADPAHTGSMGAGAYREREAKIDRDPDATEAKRREEFGGFNLGADFFGWLVAVALTVLIASIVGAIATAIGSSLNVTQTDAQRDAGTFGLATAIALLVILMLAYYAGGYVAGRMSRYDGGRQGFGVWLIGLVVTLIVVGVGVVFGSKYDIFQRVDLPSLPIPSNTATWGGIITLAAVLVGTLLAAFVGGKVGHRYHTKVDRVRS
jgi:amino acid transporter